MMPLEYDPVEMFDDFAETATWREQPVRGLFEAPFYMATIGAGAESTSPAFWCPESEAASVTRGDAIKVRDVRYSVNSVQRDGRGLIKLVLEREA